MPLEELIWRDYQLEAKQAPIDFYMGGKRKSVLEMPTGSGKTIVAGGITQEFLPSYSYGMMLVPTLDLVSQTYEKFTNYFFDEDRLGIIQGENNVLGRWFTIASKDTLDDDFRLQHYIQSIKYRKLDLLIVDECHLSITDQYRKIIDTLLSDYGMLVGLSATPNRADGQSLAKIYTDGLSYIKDIWELIRDEYLADIESYEIEMGEHMHTLSSDRYQIAYDSWYPLARNKRTLIFGKNMTDVRNFFDFFTAKGVVCHIITGKTPEGERKIVYKAFAQGSIQVLINFGVMTTGNDIPEIECIMLDRFTDNLMLWIQMVGRGLRLCSRIGKTKCIVLNLTDKRHMIFMFKKLFGTTGDKITSVRQLIKEKQEKDEQKIEEERIRIERQPIGTSVQLNGVTAYKSNMLQGDGWKEHPVTHDWEKEWIYQGKPHRFVAEKDFKGDYQPVHIDPKGRRTVLSKRLLPLPDAQRLCQQSSTEKEHKFAEKQEREKPENRNMPIRDEDFALLFERRKILIRPRGWKQGDKFPKPTEAEKVARKREAKAEMTNGDYIQIQNHLSKYGQAYSPVGGYLQYVIGQGMYVSPGKGAQ